MDEDTHKHDHGEHDHDHTHEHDHSDGNEDHGHSHGLVHESIMRSKDGIRTVTLSLGVLLAASFIQVVIFFTTNSISLLADVIHNFGDALTAIPLGVAFFLRSKIAEKYAGYFVVATIFVSACVAGFEAIMRLIHPQSVNHLSMLIVGGIVGFLGNEIAAQIRLRAGRRLNSPALIADGNHARVDGFVSLSVVASATLVYFGIQIADPIIGLLVTFLILHITWQSYGTIRRS